MKAEPDNGTRPSTEKKLEHLLEAAAALMARQGYSQTTIRDVARESGFSLAGMYYYFSSKEDLLHQIQHRTFSQLVEEQEETARLDGSPEAQLENMIRCHLAFFARHAPELKVCTFELESLTGEAFESIAALLPRYFRLAADIIASALGAAAPEADVRHLTLFVFGMLNWVFMWYQHSRDPSLDEIGTDMTKFVLGGIAAKRKERA